MVLLSRFLGFVTSPFAPLVPMISLISRVLRLRLPRAKPFWIRLKLLWRRKAPCAAEVFGRDGHLTVQLFSQEIPSPNGPRVMGRGRGSCGRLLTTYSLAISHGNLTWQSHVVRSDRFQKHSKTGFIGMLWAWRFWARWRDYFNCPLIYCRQPQGWYVR